MNVLSFMHEGLGNSLYLVGLAGGRAALIDPDRSVERYLQAGEAQGWRIDSVFETDLHNDFVSGVREAAHHTGARIFLPAGGGAQFDHHGLKAGETVRLDGLEVEVVASPGPRRSTSATSFTMSDGRRRSSAAARSSWAAPRALT